jgi:hypothetical protein
MCDCGRLIGNSTGIVFETVERRLSILADLDEVAVKITHVARSPVRGDDGAHSNRATQPVSADFPPFSGVDNLGVDNVAS